jgi:hypothetical protein
MNDPNADYNLEQSQGEIEALAAEIMQADPNLSFAQAYILAVRKLGQGQ